MDKIKSTSISYSDVGMLSQLTRDYLDEKEVVKPFYKRKSKIGNIHEAIKNKEDFPHSNRETLVQVLKDQYKELKSKAVHKNINLLLKRNTYTVTTGHQLNLFTGPLYFIYKIVSAIQTAKELKLQYPEINFVPVYWMATEDHDFEEINHTYINGNKIQWNSNQAGMVGEFSLEGIEETIEQFCRSLGNSISSLEMENLIRGAYQAHTNLADATRFLIHELFKNQGLVIIDANHKQLKQLFVPIINKELRENISYKKVSDTIDRFEDEFSAQVSPREINLFYVNEGIRERIVKSDGGFKVNNTEIEFDSSEIDSEIRSFPERFSPNVILRPVYQELILPNLVYIGGGAEVAYWLELKSTFESFNVPFPLVQIRNSFLLLSDNTVKRLSQLKLNLESIYRDKSELINLFAEKANPFGNELGVVEMMLNKQMSELENSMMQYDSELSKSVKASQKGMEKSLNKLRKKVSRSVKRQNLDYIHMLDMVFEEVYPNGVYQERQINFFEMYVKYGEKFLKMVFKNSDPFTKTFKVVEV